MDITKAVSQKSSHDDMFNFGSDSEEECSDNRNQISTPRDYELCLYKAVPDESDMQKNPLDYWKVNQNSYPRLSKLAQQYLSIPATSVPVEQLFSSAGDIVSKKRNSLTPDNANQLLSLACWLK
mgnify:CR=1 FL=1